MTLVIKNLKIVIKIFFYKTIQIYVHLILHHFLIPKTYKYVIFGLKTSSEN